MPVLRAETVQFYPSVFLRSDVFCNHIKLSYGYVEHVAFCVVDLDVVFCDSVGVNFAYSAEHAYSVNAVYNVIAHAQLGKAVNFLTFLFCFALLLLRSVRALTVGNQKELVAGAFKAGA